MSEIGSIGLNGHLNLVCTTNAQRQTYISQQSFSAPLHLSKTCWDGHVLLVHIVNQTAGVFGGDSIKTQVVVEPNARVLLSSPSATRFHPSQNRESIVEQKFIIKAGSSLEVFPEITIPQRHSRSWQKTTVEIDPEGELIYLETLTPGRVASGEIFAFSSYRWSTHIRIAGRLVHRERALLSPHNQSLHALRALFPTSYYAGFVVISPAAANWPQTFAHEVAALGDNKSIRIGASKLCAGGWSIRLLTSDSLFLRQGIAQVRSFLYAQLNRPMPEARRF